MAEKFLFCSDCFHDYGLRKTAERIGANFPARCPHCHSTTGAKIRTGKAESLVTEFFWDGSFFRTEFGGASRVVSNPYRYQDSDVQFAPWLEHDAHLVQETLKIGFLHYGPPLWRVGEIEPLQELREPETQSNAANKLVMEYPSFQIDEHFLFHRLRKQIEDDHESDPLQYDPPPDRFLGSGRLDDVGRPVLYGSQNIEICLHECRAALPDECFVAHMRPTQRLNLLDMRAEIKNDGPTEFESKNLAVHYLFSASSGAYGITRAIAKAAADADYDGIIYPSYFSSWKPERVYNIGIFGRPVADKRVDVVSINRIFLKHAHYDYTFGPLFS